VESIVRLLNEHDATLRLDRSRSKRTVHPSSRQHHGEAVSVRLGERSEEEIDRHPLASGLLENRGTDRTVPDLELEIRGNYEYVVPGQRQLLVVADLHNGHLRPMGK